MPLRRMLSVHRAFKAPCPVRIVGLFFFPGTRPGKLGQDRGPRGSSGRPARSIGIEFGLCSGNKSDECSQEHELWSASLEDLGRVTDILLNTLGLQPGKFARA
jgi:hypothetical protein